MLWHATGFNVRRPGTTGPMNVPPRLPTVREFIEFLTAKAIDCEQGLDTGLTVAICYGDDMEFMRNVDVDTWYRTDKELRPTSSTFVVIRSHKHPGDPPGLTSRGFASDADEELRELGEQQFRALRDEALRNLKDDTT